MDNDKNTSVNANYSCRKEVEFGIYELKSINLIFLSPQLV